MAPKPTDAGCRILRASRGATHVATAGNKMEDSTPITVITTRSSMMVKHESFVTCVAQRWCGCGEERKFTILMANAVHIRMKVADWETSPPSVNHAEMALRGSSQGPQLDRTANTSPKPTVPSMTSVSVACQSERTASTSPNPQMVSLSTSHGHGSGPGPPPPPSVGSHR